MKNIFLIGFTIMTTLGISSVMAASSSKVIEADEKMVESCEFLGSITKKAFIGTVKKARKNVMKEAAKEDATHVVFTESDGANAIEFASATGRAYKCGKKVSDSQ